MKTHITNKLILILKFWFHFLPHCFVQFRKFLLMTKISHMLDFQHNWRKAQTETKWTRNIPVYSCLPKLIFLKKKTSKLFSNLQHFSNKGNGPHFAKCQSSKTFFDTDKSDKFAKVFITLFILNAHLHTLLHILHDLRIGPISSSVRLH
jgi:hypothetical protein